MTGTAQCGDAMVSETDRVGAFIELGRAPLNKHKHKASNFYKH